MTWGIASAFEEEVWAVIDSMRNKTESRWRTRSLITGKICDKDIVVMTTGVGKVNTASSIQYLLDHFPVERVIFTGVAGAVNPEVKTGDIIISHSAVQHDFDIGGKDIVEEMKTARFAADPPLIELAIKACHDLGWENRAHVGTVLTGDQTVIGSDKKQWLWEAFRGDCAEMEGAATASVCCHSDVPFILIRAISDHADEKARTDFRRNRSRACKDAACVVLGMLGIKNAIRVRKRHFGFGLKRYLLRTIKWSWFLWRK